MINKLILGSIFLLEAEAMIFWRIAQSDALGSAGYRLALTFHITKDR